MLASRVFQVLSPLWQGFADAALCSYWGRSLFGLAEAIQRAPERGIVQGKSFAANLDMEQQQEETLGSAISSYQDLQVQAKPLHGNGCSLLSALLMQSSSQL